MSSAMSSSRSAEVVPILNTAAGEFALLSAIINARPVGLHKHIAMIAVMRAMEARLGEGLFTSEEVWAKLGTLYDLQMLDENSPDLEAAHQADETVLASALSAAAAANIPGGSRPPLPRRSRRTSGTHERPDDLIDPQPFDLVHRTSFQDVFARRRRGSSSSPSHAINESAIKDDQDDASDLSNPDDEEAQDEKQKAIQLTRKGSDPRVEEEENQLTPVKAEDAEDAEEDMEDSASPEREGQTGGLARSSRKGKRKAVQDFDIDVSTPQQQKRGDAKRAGRKRAKRARHRDGSPSEASSLSALSDGEEAAFKAGLARGRLSSTNTRARTRKSQSVEFADKESEDEHENAADQQEEQSSDEEAPNEEAIDEDEAAGSDHDTVEVDDDESETGTEVEDTPYKSPKAVKKRKSSTGPHPTSRSPIGRASARANATSDAKKGKSQPQLREGKTRSVVSAAQADSGHARRLSGAAANSVKKKQAKDVRKR